MTKVSLLMLLGLASAWGLRRQSAALRHLVLAAAIVVAAVLPALELVLPSWEIPVRAAIFGRAVQPLTLLVPLPAAAASDSEAATSSRGAARTPKLDAGDVLRRVWLGGAAIGLLTLVAGLARLALIAARSRVVRSGPWRGVADEFSRAYGLDRDVLLLQSNHRTLLATWGVWRPRVVLPRGADQWPIELIRSVVGHELAHVRRFDWLTHLAAAFLRCAYWFNPLVWIACARLRREGEHACDDAVLSAGIDGPDYASHLLELAREFRTHRSIPLPAPAMARPSSLERRVAAMLNVHVPRTPATKKTCLGVVLALLVLALPIASFVASAQATTATFSGTLVDAVGRVLPATTLVLSNPATSETRESTSDQAGRFTFGAMPPGEYQMQVKLIGFEKTQGRVTLAPGQTLERDVALQIGSLEESMTVSTTDVARTPAAPAAAPPYNPAGDRCSQSAVGGCITPPMPLGHPHPIYPPQQRDSGVGATVQIVARIGTDGFLKDFRVASPADAAFVDATIAALRQWQFTTTRLDGVPVEANITVTTRFVAQ